jgi:PAS domain S-box-containing protein
VSNSSLHLAEPPGPETDAAIKQQLHQSEERFRLLIDSVADYAIYMLDADGHIVSWNVGDTSIEGYSEDEVLGRHFSIFYTPEDLAAGKHIAALKIAAEAGRFSGESWRVRKDGTRFLAEFTTRPIRDNHGLLQGYGEVIRDITERKREEKESKRLRESETRFRLLVDGIKDYALFMLDREGNVASWNPGARRFKGYDDEEIIGQQFSVFYRKAEIDAGKPAEDLQKTIDVGISHEEGWRVRKDGTEFLADVTITALYDETHELLGFGKITRDMTDRKRVEDALRTSVQQYRAVVDTAVDAIVIINERGTISAFNPSAQKLFGYGMDDVLGQNVRMLMPQPNRDAHDSYLQNYLDTGVRKIIGSGREVEGLRKDGETFPLDLSIAEWFDGEKRQFTGIMRDITERKKTEEALRASVEQYRAVVDTAVDAIVIIDELGQISAFNSAAEKLFGYGSESIIGKNVRSLMPEPNRGAHDSYLNNYRATGVKKIIGIGREVQGLRADGDIFSLDLSIAEWFDGEKRQFTGIMRDVSERKKAEEALRSSANQYRAVVDTAVDAVVIIDERGTIQSFNHAAEVLFEYGMSEVIGQNVRMLMPQPNRSAHDGYLKSYRDTGVKNIIGSGREVEGLRKGGAVFSLDLSIAEWFDGKKRQFTGIMRDITQRKHSEEALRASVEQYRAVVDTAVDAIVIIDERGKISAFNSAAETLFGYLAESVIGKNVRSLMPEPNRGAHDSYLHNYRETGVKKIIGIGREVQGLRANGDVFSLDLSIAEWFDGEKRQFTGIMRDVTERKLAEAEIRDLNRDLERRVETRTHELQEANSELQAFAYSVAHDLRAPLRAMRGFSQALVEDYAAKLDDTGKDYAARVADGAARMDDLIRGLLAYSRLARDEVAVEAVSLKQVLGDVMTQLAETIEEGKATVSTEGDWPMVEGNATVLGQVLSNLIGNALKFVRPGLPAAVTLTSALVAEGRVRVTVADNGIGIAEQHYKRIFEVFQRLHGNREYAGTGIGLAVVRKGVERMGGVVGLESTLGLGSRIWFEVNTRK